MTKDHDSQVEANHSPRWIYLFPVIGIICLIYAGWSAYGEVQLRKIAVRIEGTVVDMIVVDNAEGRSYTPVLEYSWQGQTQRKKAAFSGFQWGNPVFRVNEKLPLLIAPSAPESVHIDTWSGSWVLTTLFGIIGAAFTFGAGYVIHRRHRK